MVNIPKVAARRVLGAGKITTKAYILDSWENLESGKLFLQDMVNTHQVALNELSSTINGELNLIIGFTVQYENGPTADLFMINSPTETWSENIGRRIRERDPDNIQPIGDFCDTELEILMAEKDLREFHLTHVKRGLGTYVNTFPYLKSKYIDPRCPCLADSNYRPANYTEAKQRAEG